VQDELGFIARPDRDDESPCGQAPGLLQGKAAISRICDYVQDVTEICDRGRSPVCVRTVMRIPSVCGITQLSQEVNVMPVTAPIVEHCVSRADDPVLKREAHGTRELDPSERSCAGAFGGADGHSAIVERQRSCVTEGET
jgi:hypothetical protein